MVMDLSCVWGFSCWLLALEAFSRLRLERPVLQHADQHLDTFNAARSSKLPIPAAA